MTYLTVILYNSDETESTTTSTIWQDKLIINGVIDSGSQGEHIIWAQCELTGSQKDKKIACRILLNGNERGFSYHKPDESNIYKTINFFGLRNLGSGIHQLKFQYVVSDTPQTAKIRRARILVMKH